MRRTKGQDRRPGSTMGTGPVAGTGGPTGKRPRSGERHRLRPEMLVLENRQLLAAFTVTDTSNSTTDGSNGSGSLPYCIKQADANNQPNTISFSPSVFSTPQTIDLKGSALALSDTGGMQSIIGPAAGVTIDGGIATSQRVTATLSGLTISGGSLSYGGGLDNEGNVTLTDCTLSGNFASEKGGGLYNGTNDTVTLTGCTISGNSAAGNGGGLFNKGTAKLVDCTISGNVGNQGSRIYNTTNSVSRPLRLHPDRQFRGERRRRPQQQRDGQDLRLHDRRQHGQVRRWDLQF